MGIAGSGSGKGGASWGGSRTGTRAGPEAGPETVEVGERAVGEEPASGLTLSVSVSVQLLFNPVNTAKTLPEEVDSGRVFNLNWLGNNVATGKALPSPLSGVGDLHWESGSTTEVETIAIYVETFMVYKPYLVKVFFTIVFVVVRLLNMC